MAASFLLGGFVLRGSQNCTTTCRNGTMTQHHWHERTFVSTFDVLAGSSHPHSRMRRISRLMSAFGTSRRLLRRTDWVAFGGIADVPGASRTSGCDATDPDVWSGRALQENFHRVGGCAVLHQCIRPLIGASCAPGHHRYQRACDLITGKASKGRRGHQCSHAPGRPILHLVSHPLADLGR